MNLDTVQSVVQLDQRLDAAIAEIHEQLTLIESLNSERRDAAEAKNALRAMLANLNALYEQRDIAIQAAEQRDGG